MVLTRTLDSLLSRAGQRPLLLDGAVGTELSRRGIETGLPLWSAHALTSDAGLDALRNLHAEYARAGADVLVANTFRTSRRSLAKAGRALEWRELDRRAVQCARDGASAAGVRCLVAGSIAPLEDCYGPELVPSEAECEKEHDEHIELLVALGVDFVLVETMNMQREALAAARAARAHDAQVLVSLCPGSAAALLSGEPLAQVVPALVDAAGDSLCGLLLNCASPEALERIYSGFARLAPEIPHGVYAHLGEPLADGGWKLPRHHDPDAYARWTADRIAEGARIVGGCCGTSPAHTAAQRALIDSH